MPSRRRYGLPSLLKVFRLFTDSAGGAPAALTSNVAGPTITAYETGRRSIFDIPAGGQTDVAITVIGLGYVGVVAAASLAAARHRVLGVDIDRNRTTLLRSGHVPFYEPGLEEIIQSAVAAGCLSFAHRDAVAGPLGEVALITTGTSQTEGGAADLNQVRSALSWIKSQPSSSPVIVMKSTAPPGAGQRIIEHDGSGAAGIAFRLGQRPELKAPSRPVPGGLGRPPRPI